MASHRSLWLIVTLLILGASVGYTLLVARQGGLAFSAAVRCEMPEEVCANGNCDNHPACAAGACSSDCPGNCQKTPPT